MVFSQRWRAAMSVVVGVFCSAAAAQAAVVKGSISTEGANPKPIPGAVVVVGYLDGTTSRYSAPTPADEQGNFSVTVPDDPKGAESTPRNSYTLFAYAPGYAMAQLSIKPDASATLHLSPEQTIKGQVLDSTGKPVAGVTISLSGEAMLEISKRGYIGVPPGQGKPLVATSDAQGRWQVGGIQNVTPALDVYGEPTAAAVLDIRDPRFVRSSLFIPLGDPKDRTLHVRAGGTITGRVVDASGNPEAGVIVSAASSERHIVSPGVQNDMALSSGNTGADGTFTLPCLPKGNYIVSVGAVNAHGEEVPLVAVAATNVAVAEGKSTALASPLVLKPGAGIEGTVLSKETNNPVPGVMLYAYGPQNPRNDSGVPPTSGLTDADGKFSLRVAEGDSEVHVGSRVDGFIYVDPQILVTLRGTETKVLPPILLPATRHVLLQVKDEAGKPVANFPLIVEQPDAAEFPWNQAAHTDDQGVWDSKDQNQPDIAADETRPWTIKTPAGWDLVSPANLTLPADSPVAVVVRKSDALEHPHGRIVTPDGKPVAAANVNAFSYFQDGDNQRDYQNENVQTDVNGQFLLTPLRPGVTAHIGIDKGDYRRGHNGAIDSLIHMPSEGKQPDLGDLVLIPLTSSVSGTVIDAAHKPVAGVWLWSLDGDQRSLTHTDAGGHFTIEHLPSHGPILVHAAYGSVSTLYTAVDRGKAAIQLPPTKHIADSAAAIRNRRRGLALLSELVHEAAPAQGPRDDGNGKDTLADMMASLDVDIAVHVGTPKGGPVDEKVLSGILENAVQSDPVKARALFLAHRNEWHDLDVLFYRNIDMAMAFANRDPAFANDCYHAAAKLIGESISPDSVGNVTALAKVAYRLNAPDADEWAQKAIIASAKVTSNTSESISAVSGGAAEGDGVRAAKLILDVPPDKRQGGEAQILYGMAAEQPLEAKQLLDSWINDGTLDPANNQIGWQFSQAIVRLTKALSVHDPAAALVVAKKAPENIRWEAMLWAASAEPDAAARIALYRQVILAGNSWDSIKRLPEGIYFAKRTHDTALVNELRDSLANSVLTGVGIFDGNASENAARVTAVLGVEKPDLCRLLLEMAIDQTVASNADMENEMWLLRQGIQAMALIDVDRAIQIAEGVRGTNGVAKSKMEIVRALLTPPAKWRDLNGDPQN